MGELTQESIRTRGGTKSIAVYTLVSTQHIAIQHYVYMHVQYRSHVTSRASARASHFLCD